MPKRAARPDLADTPSAVLNPARYNRLMQDVQVLLKRAGAAEERQRVASHWNVGRRIARERLQTAAGYHNSILRDLAQANRVAVRTLQYAVKFHTLYPKCPKTSLKLGHYRLLIDCPSADHRAHYEALAIDQSLSLSALRQRMVQDQHERAGTSTLLQRPDERDYTFRAVVEQVIDGDTFDLRIDTGFNILTFDRFRLFGIDCPERPTKAGRAARDFVYTHLIAAKTIVVQTVTHDIHGRYVAHLFYTTEKTDIRTCFHEGHYLNEQLLQAGHAVLA